MIPREFMISSDSRLYQYQGSVGSHTEENRPTLPEILPLLRAERFTERFTS